MTPLQAYAQSEHESGGGTVTAIPADVTVQLGLLTFPVGPYCGAECDGYKVENGIAYHALNELAYGYSYSVCKPGLTMPARRCIRWTFLDASTGHVIDMVLNLAGRRPGLTRRIRAAAIPTLKAAAIKAARHNGDPAPRSIKAVATTHARARPEREKTAASSEHLRTRRDAALTSGAPHQDDEDFNLPYQQGDSPGR